LIVRAFFEWGSVNGSDARMASMCEARLLKLSISVTNLLIPVLAVGIKIGISEANARQ